MVKLRTILKWGVVDVRTLVHWCAHCLEMYVYLCGRLPLGFSVGIDGDLSAPKVIGCYEP